MDTGTGVAPPPAATLMVAPAKLTLSLRVLGARPDGYHELVAEMVSLDLADELVIDPGGEGLEIEAAPGSRARHLPAGAHNLVVRALAAARRSAGVRLCKRIPVQGGLGGGSTDAAAVLRWARCADVETAASLGADVPFCVHGGRATVTGLGEGVLPLPFEARSLVLLLPPFGVDTGAVYAAWDRLAASAPEPPGHGARNELQAAAITVAPALARWGERLGELTGRTPTLAGSGSTWFVEGDPVDMGVGGITEVALGGDTGQLRAVRTVPARWGEKSSGGVPPGGG